MIEHVKLLGMTMVLAIVIWIIADSLVNETTSVPISFEVATGATGTDTVVALDDEVQSFRLRVVGPRQAITRVQADAPLSVRLQVPELPTGTAQIPLKETLEEQWHAQPNLRIIAVDPPQLSVVVDRFVTKEVQVIAERERLTRQYEVRPQVQPTTIRLSIRESVFQKIAPSGQLSPLDISAEAERLLREQPTGQSVSVQVTLDASAFGPGARLLPPAVEVRATLASQRTTTEIPTVPILLAVNFANFGKPVTAVLRDGSELVTQTIRVTGPTDEVSRLVRGETRAYGIVQLKDEHFALLEQFRPLKPEYQLPPGITLASEPEPIVVKLSSVPGKSPTP